MNRIVLTVALALCTASLAGAQTAPNAQFRDVMFQLPGTDWRVISPDPSPELSGRRAMFGREEAYHELRLIVYSQPAPPLLAPSEVVDQWVAQQKKTVDAGSSDGTYSNFQSGMRSLGGRDLPTLSARYTRNLIALDVNGTRVAEARNSELFQGSAGIGGGTFSGSSALPDVRFSNLKIVQR